MKMPEQGSTGLMVKPDNIGGGEVERNVALRSVYVGSSVDFSNTAETLGDWQKEVFDAISCKTYSFWLAVICTAIVSFISAQMLVGGETVQWSSQRQATTGSDHVLHRRSCRRLLEAAPLKQPHHHPYTTSPHLSPWYDFDSIKLSSGNGS